MCVPGHVRGSMNNAGDGVVGATEDGGIYLPSTGAFTWTVMTPQPSAVGKRATKKVFYILTAVDTGFYLPKSNYTFFSPPAE